MDPENLMALLADVSVPSKQKSKRTKRVVRKDKSKKPKKVIETKRRRSKRIGKDKYCVKESKNKKPKLIVNNINNNDKEISDDTTQTSLLSLAFEKYIRALKKSKLAKEAEDVAFIEYNKYLIFGKLPIKSQSKELKVCSFCGITETTQWRRGSESVVLCNSCGLTYIRKNKK